MSFNYIVDDAFKSADEVLNRLFNHKPFLEAEIRSMVRDHEEDQPADLHQILDSAHERILDISDKQIGIIDQYCSNRLPPLEAKVDRAEQLMQKLLQMELIKTNERKEKMSNFIRAQNEEMVEVMKQMDSRIGEIDASYEKAREQVYLKYNSHNKDNQ